MSVKIFFCYAHEDEVLLNKLKTHLRPLQRQGLINLWYDRDISAGTEWESEISQHLNSAQIILLLVSPDFMNSDYCYGIEMQRAIERHERKEACVIPVILRPVYWQGVLGKLQALPTDAKPVISPSWHSLDEALFDVAEGVRKTVKDLKEMLVITPRADPTNDVLLESIEQVLKPEEIASVRELVRSGSGEIITTTILAQAIIVEGLKHLTAGVNPFLLRKGLEQGTQAVITVIRSLARPLQNSKELALIASSAVGDAQIGEMIAEVKEKIGWDGIILIEEGVEVTTQIKYVEGIQFDRGYLSHHFVTDTKEREAVLENPFILISEQAIQTIQDIVPILEKMIKQEHRDILIIAPDVGDEVLQTLLVNKLRGILNVLVVKAPGLGEYREQMLYDMAILTGGQVINEELGHRFDSLTLDDLGSARKVISHEFDTKIIEGRGKVENIQRRIQQIKAQVEESTSFSDREKLQERLTKLVAAVSIIYVGGFTKEEITWKKRRFKTALFAANAAVEGFVAGGGSTFIAAIPVLKKVQSNTLEEQEGVNILRRALEEPLRQIAHNAGYKGDVVAEGLKKPYGNGFDASTGKYIDMFQAGRVEPTKIICWTVQTATKIAGDFLTKKALEDE